VVGSLIAGDSALMAISTKILFEGPLPVDANCPKKPLFRKLIFRIMNLQEKRTLNQGIADGARQHDDALGPLCLPNKRGDVQFCDGAWLA
jgi:hypothetical protein